MSLDFAWKPPSGDGSYDGFNLKQAPLGASRGPMFLDVLQLQPDASGGAAKSFGPGM
jgi:hypothetical protein